MIHTPSSRQSSAAVAGEYDVIVVDSFSHAWEGVLALKDRLTAQDERNDGFGVWRQVTPLHDRLVDVMLRVPAHLIVTLRTKTAYDYEQDGRSGKNRVVKVGTKPIAREGVEYEFDVVADMDLELNFSVSKTRCPELTGRSFTKPGPEVADILSGWLTDGEPAVSPRQANELLATMNALAPPRRRACKEGFVNAFGRPENLPAAKLESAQEFVARFAAAGRGQARLARCSASCAIAHHGISRGPGPRRPVMPGPRPLDSPTRTDLKAGPCRWRHRRDPQGRRARAPSPDRGRGQQKLSAPTLTSEANSTPRGAMGQGAPAATRPRSWSWEIPKLRRSSFFPPSWSGAEASTGPCSPWLRRPWPGGAPPSPALHFRRGHRHLRRDRRHPRPPSRRAQLADHADGTLYPGSSPAASSRPGAENLRRILSNSA